MNLRRALVFGLAALLGALASSCASGVRPVVEPPTCPTVNSTTYLAQSVVADCRPGDSSMVCCIKKFPRTPVESCGATAAEAAEVLNGVKVLNEATQPTADGTAQEEGDDEFAHNAHLPEWKQRCIRAYSQCQDDAWTGSCHDCLRRCEGQHEWPTTMCGPRKSLPKK
jgi:hypothetical protein